MRPSARRDFLRTSVAGFSSLYGAATWAADSATKESAAASPSTSASADPFDTLFLTWRRDPTTTMMVQWIAAPMPGPTMPILYAPYVAPVKPAAPAKVVAPVAATPIVVEDAAIWQTALVETRPYHPLSELKVHRAELTGLKPGIEYRFRIGGLPQVHRFRTMPVKATDTFSFISGGDCGVNSHVVANNILAAKQNPMFALIGGDIAYDNGHDIKTNLAFYRNYSKHMVDADGRHVPMVVGIGNHEVKGGYKAQRNDGPLFFNLHDGLYAERSYATLDFGDYLSLALLDSGHVAPIDGEQTAWLDRVLAERDERPHLIAVDHVPCYPSYRTGDGTDLKPGAGQLNRKHWVPLFEKHNVDLVLEHHDHTFKRTRPMKDGKFAADGIVYLGDGSWGKIRPPKPTEQRPYLAVADDSYHITLHRLEGEERFHLALDESGRVVDVCRTTKRPTRRMGRSAV